MARRSFKAGEIQKFCDRYGRSHLSLAYDAGVTPTTIFRANRGDDLRRSTFVAIFNAMARVIAGGASLGKLAAPGLPAPAGNLKSE